MTFIATGKKVWKKKLDIKNEPHISNNNDKKRKMPNQER